ncbi:MAG: hypothetical protein O2955_19280 [Planctomycetota bacterium]|nr:hypothetical protein [Planctomycetota bacterium]MDA1214657.1 hypothetical protein [Planctomycetota bacterium]
MHTFVRSWERTLFLGVLIGVFCGCGGGDDAPVREYADVTGKVTYNGEALTKGKVMFQPPSGAMVVGDIQADGTYSLKGVIGPNSVAIESRDDQGQMSADNPKSRQEPKSYIPPEYGTPASGLSFEVKAGTNTADFDLK